MIKNILYLCALFLLLVTANGRAQDVGLIAPCNEVQVTTDSVKRAILSNFIELAVKERYFLNDKGIIHLYIYEDKEGLIRWDLVPIIDDRYKHNPPYKFEDFDGDIILIFDADSKGNALINKSPEQYVKCLEQVIGDRVYIQPTMKGRWANYTLPWGRKVTTGTHRASTGGLELIVIFNKDGSYDIKWGA